MPSLSGPLAALLPTPPLGAVVTGLFVVAVPTMLLMTVWAIVTMYRVLFPERPLPFDAAVRRGRALRRGEGRQVRLRDILEDQRRQPAPPVFPARRALADREPKAGPVAPGGPLFDDLWLRRN